MSAIREGRRPQTSAPLFHSAADFLPEDPEHEQERLDLYSLERSRRHFGAYAPSNGTGGGGDDDDEDDDADYSGDDSTQELRRSGGRGRFGNIRSSWRAGTQREPISDSMLSDGTERDAESKGKMVDVRLDQSETYSDTDDYDHSVGTRAYNPPADITIEMPRDESPPPFQTFKTHPRGRSPFESLAFVPPMEHEPEGDDAPFLPRETERPKPQVKNSIPHQVYHPVLEPPAHDKVWGNLYIFLMASMFTTSFVVWLHTERHDKLKFADTIYNTLGGSLHLLTVDTFVAIGVALLWMYLLKSFVKPLIYFISVSVPLILVAFSIYPFVMSFKPPGGKDKHGYGGQGTVMRWGSIIPAIMSITWTYTAWRSRYAMTRAISIIQLACRIIGENPALVLLSFGTLVGTCLFSWLWLGMFTEVFLTGDLLQRDGFWTWKLRTRTVVLGIYYIMMYLWTLGIASSVHRATSAATVSQWYFHRHAIPMPSSKAILSAAFHHSTSTLFGSISLWALLALLVRVPLYVAPRSISRILHAICYTLVPSPIAAVISPLTVTYAAIHSLPLLVASKATAGLKFFDTAGYGPQQHPRAAYRLSKMLLTAARGVTAMALGVVAWVSAARDVNGGSAYGYIVGLVAGAIAWAVIGATEGCLSNVVDACAVCVMSEGTGPSRCREAQAAFGG
ncbi:hypothetical protein FN846DRAFT_900749 [Sphaerosporella brunnea]|uniref:Protein PNS1 n=1 Tax=Sphaerosporella brunnea TaxID=1250544 RepID=A0A5J5EIA0_9PEZI|nr:hypothetical protein FN846DRAFT_900749 [Sphaerosporella brunnea]